MIKGNVSAVVDGKAKWTPSITIKDDDETYKSDVFYGIYRGLEKSLTMQTMRAGLKPVYPEFTIGADQMSCEPVDMGMQLGNAIAEGLSAPGSDILLGGMIAGVNKDGSVLFEVCVYRNMSS